MPRPSAYDSHQVVTIACDLFWANGFETCDVERLTRDTGLNRHSLYKAFGGKRGLFEKALSQYVDAAAASFLAVLDEGTGRDAILRYFAAAQDVLTQGLPNDANGCFVTNTVVELGQSVPGVSAIVARHYAAMEDGFCEALLRGQADGTVRADIDAASTARWLMLTSQGLSVSARFGLATGSVTRAIEDALTPPTAS